MSSRLPSYLPFKSPRRRVLVGKHKRQYKDMDAPIKEVKINEIEKQQFLDKFKLKKEQEKKQRLILTLVLISIGILCLSLMFIIKAF